jgi:hypothetical protein
MPRRRRYQHHFSVRVTTEELRALHARARTAQLSLARYLVEAGLSEERVLSPEERRQREAALFHVRKIGVNLNQIAHRLNGGVVVPPARLEAALVAVTQALAQFGGKDVGS